MFPFDDVIMTNPYIEALFVGVTVQDLNDVDFSSQIIADNVFFSKRMKTRKWQQAVQFGMGVVYKNYY